MILYRRPMWAIAKLSVLLLLLPPLAGCSSALEDRENVRPDEMRDATQVVVWRNADRVPNIATFCADGRAWVTTLNDPTGARGQLLRDAERDSKCTAWGLS